MAIGNEFQLSQLTHFTSRGISEGLAKTPKSDEEEDTHYSPAFFRGLCRQDAMLAVPAVQTTTSPRTATGPPTPTRRTCVRDCCQLTVAGGTSATTVRNLGKLPRKGGGGGGGGDVDDGSTPTGSARAFQQIYFSRESPKIFPPSSPSPLPNGKLVLLFPAACR